MIEKDIISNFNNGMAEVAKNSTARSGNFFAEDPKRIFKEFELEIDWDMLKEGFTPPMPETASVSFRG